MIKPRFLIIFALSTCLCLLGACSDDDGGQDSGAPDSSPADLGPPDTVSSQACMPACKADEGCLAVTVTRTSDETNLPWKLFPGDADGFGDLHVAAYTGADLLAEGKEPNADYQYTTSSYTVELCAPGDTTLRVAAWLDDDGDSPAGAKSSGDYADSCCQPRNVEVTTVRGKRVSVTMQLKTSCD